MEELKRCPFCGGEAKLNVQTRDLDGSPQTWSICCVGDCFAEMTYYADKEKLIKAWNTRTK